MWLTVKRWPPQEGHDQNRERKCGRGIKKNWNGSFFFPLCGYVNVLPILLKFALLLNANFSINPFHANF